MLHHNRNRCEGEIAERTLAEQFILTVVLSASGRPASVFDSFSLDPERSMSAVCCDGMRREMRAMDRFVSGKDIVKKTRPNGGKVVSSKAMSSKAVSSASGHDNPLGFTKVKLTATQKRRALKPRKTPAKPALA
jgi:hypothetical protein